jgi:hypothetical protein
MNENLRRVYGLFDDLEWRHHAIGVMQAYIPGTDGNERVHVWSSLLDIEPDAHGGARHNHRWDLNSAVLVGQLAHQRLLVVDDDGGEYQRWLFVGASKGSDDAIEFDGRVSVVVDEGRVFKAGAHYSVIAGDYHCARPLGNEATVTLVSRGARTSLWASAVTRVKPLHAIDRPHPYWDETKWRRTRELVLAEAKFRLGQEIKKCR